LSSPGKKTPAIAFAGRVNAGQQWMGEATALSANHLYALQAEDTFAISNYTTKKGQCQAFLGFLDEMAEEDSA